MIEITDVDGQTWEEWSAEMFEFHYCDECGKDKEDHNPILFIGHWFAQCQATV